MMQEVESTTSFYFCASRYTGKMRDTETNLDYFGARYNSSSLGRFMSPDWAGKPTSVPYAEFGNPQSLNLYSYVGNNPMLHFDPDGHCWPLSACAEKFAGIFYVKGTVGPAVELGIKVEAGHAQQPETLGVSIGGDLKSTGKLTTAGVTVSTTKEAGLTVDIGKYKIGPQISKEQVTVKDGKALFNQESEKSASALFGTEKIEGTASKGDVGVGAEVDIGIITIGIGAGINIGKLHDLLFGGQSVPALPAPTPPTSTTQTSDSPGGGLS